MSLNISSCYLISIYLVCSSLFRFLFVVLFSLCCSVLILLFWRGFFFFLVMDPFYLFCWCFLSYLLRVFFSLVVLEITECISNLPQSAFKNISLFHGIFRHFTIAYFQLWTSHALCSWSYIFYFYKCYDLQSIVIIIILLQKVNRLFKKWKDTYIFKNKNGNIKIFCIYHHIIISGVFYSFLENWISIWYF